MPVHKAILVLRWRIYSAGFELFTSPFCLAFFYARLPTPLRYFEGRLRIERWESSALAIGEVKKSRWVPSTSILGYSKPELRQFPNHHLPQSRIGSSRVEKPIRVYSGSLCPT